MNQIRSIKNFIITNIKQNEEDNAINNLKIPIKEFADVKNYYIRLNINIETIANFPKERFLEINKAYRFINNEYEVNKAFYIGEKKQKIEIILTTLQELSSILSKEAEEIDIKNKVINIVTSAFNNGNDAIKKERTSQENEKEEYIEEIRDFATNIKKYLNDVKKENKYPIFPKELDGTSVKAKSGFKFIIEYTKEETRIKDENGTDEIGTTPREIALTFYKLSLSKELESDVILIDQPEDDISMKRIENYMIDYFNSIRDKKQIIFVTHNPLLVVNLDVDNVINVSKNRKNILSIQSGCIESSNMIDLLSQNLDGGKEAIEITDTNKELKATEIIEFLNYSKEASYSSEPLNMDLTKDKNILSIHIIFEEIIEKLNPISSENIENVYPF